VWWSGSWKSPDAAGSDDAAAELESMGYGTLWSSGRFDAGLSPHFEKLLASTSQILVASGIVSIWVAAPDDVGTAVAQLDEKFPGRFLLGLGASHSALVQEYQKPYSRMVEYLDALDSLHRAVHSDRRVLAALGPRMLELAAARSAGAHPYFVTVEHTARARIIMGEGPLLAPEVAVVLDEDPSSARAAARAYAGGYLQLPNYASNLRSLGYAEEDFQGDGSDRLIDALVPWGSVETIAARVHEHHAAGASHVCIQVVAPYDSFPLTQYRELSEALL
jgi:probable F420-dependent oxidoreductase